MIGASGWETTATCKEGAMLRERTEALHPPPTSLPSASLPFGCPWIESFNINQKPPSEVSVWSSSKLLNPSRRIMGSSTGKLTRQTHEESRYPIRQLLPKGRSGVVLRDWALWGLHPFRVLSELNKIIGQPGGVEELENWLSSEKKKKTNDDQYLLVEQMTDWVSKIESMPF